MFLICTHFLQEAAGEAQRHRLIEKFTKEKKTLNYHKHVDDKCKFMQADDFTSLTFSVLSAESVFFSSAEA